jgi:hypothetical protein
MNLRQFIEMLGAFSAMYLSLAFIICISLVISDGESGKKLRLVHEYLFGGLFFPYAIGKWFINVANPYNHIMLV